MEEEAELGIDNVHELLSSVMEYMYQEKGIEGIYEVVGIVESLASNYIFVEANTHDYKKDMN